MAKRESGKDQTAIVAPSNIPSYLAELAQDDTSMDALQKYRVLPRFKVVQSTAKQELLAVFAPGDVILQPGQVQVAKANPKEMKSSEFMFVPLCFYTEFCKWSDLKDQQSPRILERSFDPTSEVAKKSQDAKLRQEKYGQGFIARYCEHLNYPGVIIGDHPLNGTAAAISFSRGEYTTGLNFANSLMLRKLPLWAQVMSIRTGFRNPTPDKKWWGMDLSYSRVATEEEAPNFKSLHLELKELIDKKLLVVDHAEGDDDVDGANDAAAEGRF